MKKYLSTLSGFALALAIVLTFGADSASALTLQEGVEAARGAGVPEALLGDGSIITTIINLMLFLAGALAVIMLIFGGLRYTISGGNSAKVTAAKNTILYAIVGLIIAFLAFAVVNFVLGSLTGGFSGGDGTNV